MPGSISVPNSGSFENKDNTGSQRANKKKFKKGCNKKWLSYVDYKNLTSITGSISRS
jgi:hypothetical protein